MTTADIDRIHNETHARALLSLQTDNCRQNLGIVRENLERHAKERGIVLVNTPMRDFDSEDQRVRLPSAVTALVSLLKAGYRTYIHCNAGINRAPLTVLAYLTFVEEMTPGDAMALIRRGRPEAEPYWESYHSCRDDLLRQNRASVELRAWILSQRDTDRPPDANWLQAEREVLIEQFGASEGF